MKKLMAFSVATMFLLMFAVNVWAGKIDKPSNLGEAIRPPSGAMITITPLDGYGQRIIKISGFPEIYKNRIEIYGGDKVETETLVDGSCKYPAGSWINFIFKGSDGNYHYVLVKEEDRVVIQPFFGPGVGVIPDFGKGCALIYEGDLRK